MTNTKATIPWRSALIIKAAHQLYKDQDLALKQLDRYYQKMSAYHYKDPEHGIRYEATREDYLRYTDRLNTETRNYADNEAYRKNLYGAYLCTYNPVFSPECIKLFALKLLGTEDDLVYPHLSSFSPKELQDYNYCLTNFEVGLQWLHDHQQETQQALQNGFQVQQDLYQINFGKKAYFSQDPTYLNKGHESKFFLGFESPTLLYQTEFTKQEISDYMPDIQHLLKDHQTMILEKVTIPAFVYDYQQKEDELSPMNHAIDEKLKQLKVLETNKLDSNESTLYLTGIMQSLILGVDIFPKDDDVRDFLNHTLLESFSLPLDLTGSREDISALIAHHVINFTYTATMKLARNVTSYLNNLKTAPQEIKSIHHSKTNDIAQELSDWLS